MYIIVAYMEHNVLLRPRRPGVYDVVLADYGITTEDQNESNDEEQNEKRNAWYHFVAHEVFSDLVYSPKSDVYSFGMLLYWVVTLTLPWLSLTSGQVILRMARGKHPEIPEDLQEDTHKELMSARTTLLEGVPTWSVPPSRNTEPNSQGTFRGLSVIFCLMMSQKKGVRQNRRV